MDAPDDHYALAVDLGTGGPKVGLVSLTGELAWFEHHRRHFVARLDAMWIGNPAGQVGACIGERAGRDRLAASQVCQVRAECAIGICAANGVAIHARRAQKCLLAFEQQRISGDRRRLLLPGNPGCILLGWLGDHQEFHVGVLCATIFGTLAAKCSHLIGLQPEGISLPRHQIHFAG